MEKMVFQGRTAIEVGRAHGERFAREIAEIAAIRAELALEKGDLEGPAELRALAAAHLPVLRRYDEALADELTGIAEGSGVSPEDLVVLNHYTDLRDITRKDWRSGAADPDDQRERDPGGCSMALLPPARPGEAVTGQTWDMHASAEPYVRLIEVRLEGAPTATLLSLTGCLGMAGLNDAGVGVLINNLTTSGARIGAIWSAVVRRMLRERTAEAAAEVLLRSPIGSGHHYLVCDGRDAFSVEATGQHKHVYQRGTDRPLLHTNHCRVPDLVTYESISEASTTHIRMDHLKRRVAGLPGVGVTAVQLADAFGCHVGFPKSLCLHGGPGDPHATATCGALVLDHARRTVLAVRGCCVESAWTLTEVGSDRTAPLAAALPSSLD